MPGLIACKRRWLIGSDDFVLPGVILAALHVTFFIVISIYVSTNLELTTYGNLDVEDLSSRNANSSFIEQAECAHDILTILYIYLFLLIVAALLEIVMVCFSMQGTILDSSPRKPVEYIIYVRIALSVIEISYIIFASVKLKYQWSNCQPMQHVISIQTAIVISNAILFAILLLNAFLIFDEAGGLHHKTDKASKRFSITSSNLKEIKFRYDQQLRKSWFSCVNHCFCCLSKSSDTKLAIEDASHLLYNFFREFDLIPSDVMAGLVLLRQKQLQSYHFSHGQLTGTEGEQEFLTGKLVDEQSVFYDPTNKREVQHFKNIMYYCNYAIASYGPIFYAMDCGCGVCKLTKQCMTGPHSCCFQQNGSHQPILIQDTTCNCRISAFRQSLQDSGSIDNIDIVYASFDNNVYKQPFFVCVDHLKKAVVVTVRGTMSEIDALTDICAHPVTIPVQGRDNLWKGHKGMVEGAVYIQEQLVKGKILSRAFNFNFAQGTQDYGLVIIGHSLGAGVASILSIMLRPMYPNLVCFSYSPPGGLLCYASMQASKHYINSTVLGKDIVIRSGILQLEKFRSQVISLLKHTQVPKYRVLLGNFVKSLEKRNTMVRDKSFKENLLPHNSLHGSDNNHDRNSDSVELFPPGRILHIVYRKKTQQRKLQKGAKLRKLYFAMEADNVNDFQEIIISRNMIAHHMPQQLLSALEKVLLSSGEKPRSKYSQAPTLPMETKFSKEAERGSMGNISPDAVILTQPTYSQDNERVDLSTQENGSNSNKYKWQKSTTSQDSVFLDSNHPSYSGGHVRQSFINPITALSAQTQVDEDSNIITRALVEPNIVPKPPRRQSTDKKTMFSSTDDV